MGNLAESLERIAKWLRADQEGRLAYQEDRLVEFPMNMGTECWIVVEDEGELRVRKEIFGSVEQIVWYGGEIGERVFLKREEAERMMEEKGREVVVRWWRGVPGVE